MDLKAISIIQLCLADEIMYNVMDEETATGLWSKLERDNIYDEKPLHQAVSQENVSILSTSYSLKKNSGSSGAVTNFRDQARTCIGLVHVISRLMFSLVDLYFLYSRLVLARRVRFLNFVRVVD